MIISIKILSMGENEKSGYICGNINSGSAISIKVW
jgi:hypothetical protein